MCACVCVHIVTALPIPLLQLSSIHRMLLGTLFYVILISFLGPEHRMTIPTLQVKKLRLREVKPLAQAHTARKEQDWNQTQAS